MFDFIKDLWRRHRTPRTVAGTNPTQDRIIRNDTRDRYRRELIDNNGKVDRNQAEAIVRRIYEFANLPPPLEFIWVDKPEDSMLAATLIARDWAYRQNPLDNIPQVPKSLLGRTLRRALVASHAQPPDDGMLRTAGMWLPSLDDASRVFRRRIGGKGLLTMTKDTPFAIDSWLDKFLALEEEFESQSPQFAKRWKQAATGIWALSEAEHREQLGRLRRLGRDILDDYAGGIWFWHEPYMLSGTMEAYYAAIAELHLIRLRARHDTCITDEGLQLLLEYIHHCGWCFPFEDVCIMADRPEQLFDMHDIDTESNIEARRLMIELYGLGHYLADKHARLVAKDSYGNLYRIPQQYDEDLVVVKVINSTPEPDGTFREYFLRVPPDTPTARSGVAWSFGLREDDYAPAVET